MLLTKKVFKTAFIEALKKNGLTIYFNRNDYFILINGKDSSRIVSVELVCSTKIDTIVHGSHNNNKVDGIGHFLFSFPKWEDKTNFYVFAFLDTTNHEIEFVVVPDAVLRSRLQNQNRISSDLKKEELTLWLMENRKVYDSTQIQNSLESLWYFYSKGNTGNCMADGSEMDYSDYLNNWRQLTN